LQGWPHSVTVISWNEIAISPTAFQFLTLIRRGPMTWRSRSSLRALRRPGGANLLIRPQLSFSPEVTPSRAGSIQGSPLDAPGRKAFLFGQAGHVCGYLALADKTVTGYREPSAHYREAEAVERVIRPCVMVVWVVWRMRRCGVARQLVDAAARHCGVSVSGLAWAEPFTGSGYLFARSTTPNGLWIADYSQDRLRRRGYRPIFGS
jgi:hypothetical protein